MNEKDIIDSNISNYACVILTGTCLASEPSRSATFFAIKIANSLSNNDCLLLFGEIGVGKTTFVRYLINYLQKKNKLKQSHVLSPTFNLVYDYDLEKWKPTNNKWTWWIF